MEKIPWSIVVASTNNQPKFIHMITFQEWLDLVKGDTDEFL